MSRQVLILLRHGTTEWNRTGRLNSRTDIPLAPEGIEQAARLARQLSDLPIGRVMVSPSRRARETAAPLRTLVPASVSWEVDPRLVEMDFGPFEGRDPAEISMSALAAEFAAWRRETDPAVPRTAESYGLAARRAQAVFDSLQPDHEVTLIVTHGYMVRILLAHCVLGMPPEHMRRLRMDNARFAVVVWESGNPQLVAMNTATLEGVIQCSVGSGPSKAELSSTRL